MRPRTSAGIVRLHLSCRYVYLRIFLPGELSDVAIEIRRDLTVNER